MILLLVVGVVIITNELMNNYFSITKLQSNRQVVHQANSSIMAETVKQLMEHLDLKSPIIIVEHNEKILQKSDHELVKVQEGDTIEFVQFVGGG